MTIVPLSWILYNKSNNLCLLYTFYTVLRLPGLPSTVFFSSSILILVVVLGAMSRIIRLIVLVGLILRLGRNMPFGSETFCPDGGGLPPYFLLFFLDFLDFTVFLLFFDFFLFFLRDPPVVLFLLLKRLKK